MRFLFQRILQTYVLSTVVDVFSWVTMLIQFNRETFPAQKTPRGTAMAIPRGMGLVGAKRFSRL